MNDMLMKPFRAPRGAKGRARPTETESGEATALGVVCERYVIKETEETVANKRGEYKLWETVRDDKETGEEWEARCDHEEMERSGPDCWTMEKERVLAEGDSVPHESSKVLSPSLSDFEAYLDKREAAHNHIAQDDSDYEWNATDIGTKAGVETCDDMNSRMIGIEDILLEEFGDDAQPAVTKTNKGKKQTKTFWTFETVAERTGLASKYWDSPAATTRASRRIAKDAIKSPLKGKNEFVVEQFCDADKPVHSKNQKEKKTSTKLWTYVPVAEPTGVASHYWDGAATTERASKRLAKERLVAIEKAAASDTEIVGSDKVIEIVKDRSWLIGAAAIGVSIARDFGRLGGVLSGKIGSLKDSGTSSLYHVIYTDGREEDLERDEFLRGYELFGAMALGTYKPLPKFDSEGSSDDKFGSEDAWSSDCEQKTKGKRRAKKKPRGQPKQSKRKACRIEPHGGKGSSANKKAKITPSKDDLTKVKKITVKSSFTLDNVLAAWTDTTDFGASFRYLDAAEQKKELAQINVGAAKGINGAVKSKVLKAQYKDMMANK
jgi:hypothetical protein